MWIVVANAILDSKVPAVRTSVAPCKVRSQPSRNSNAQNAAGYVFTSGGMRSPSRKVNSGPVASGRQSRYLDGSRNGIGREDCIRGQITVPLLEVNSVAASIHQLCLSHICVLSACFCEFVLGLV